MQHSHESSADSLLSKHLVAAALCALATSILGCGIDDRSLSSMSGMGGGSQSGTGGSTGGGAGSASTGGGRLGDASPTGGAAGSDAGGTDTGVTSTSLTIDPPGADFHTVVVGSTASAVFRVSNGGGAPTSVPVIQLTGTDANQFSIVSNGCSSAIAPGNDCGLTIQFKPASDGTKSAELGVSAGPGISSVAALTGIAVNPGALRIDTLSKDFGSSLPGVASAPARFVIRNTGAARAPVGIARSC